MHATAPKRVSEKRQLQLILLITFISFVGISMPYPLLPPLFLHPEPNGMIPLAWGSVARNWTLGITLAVYPLGQFLGSPLLGAWSDHWGRKKVLLISLIGTMLGYLGSALALEWQSLSVLIVSRLLGGFWEGNIAIARAMAIDLDNIPKTKSLGRINAMAAIGYVIGPLASGLLVIAAHPFLSTRITMALPFYLASFVVLITVVLTQLQIKDAHHSVSAFHQPNEKFSWNIFHRIKKLLQKNKLLMYLLGVNACFCLGVDIFYEFGPVFLAQWPMNAEHIAFYNAALCAGLAMGAGGIAYRLLEKYHPQKIIPPSIGATGFFLIGIGMSHCWWVSLILFFVIGLSITQITTYFSSAVSNSVEKNVQGEVMGTMFALRMLGDSFICLVGAILSMAMPSLPLFLAAIFVFLAIFLFLKMGDQSLSQEKL